MKTRKAYLFLLIVFPLLVTWALPYVVLTPGSRLIEQPLSELAGQCDREKREGDKAHTGLKPQVTQVTCSIFFPWNKSHDLAWVQMAKKYTPATERGAKYWQSQSRDEHLAACILIIPGESGQTPTRLPSGPMGQIRTKSPLLSLVPPRGAWTNQGLFWSPMRRRTQDKNQDSGCRWANQVFHSVIFWMKQKLKEPFLSCAIRKAS